MKYEWFAHGRQVQMMLPSPDNHHEPFTPGRCEWRKMQVAAPRTLPRTCITFRTSRAYQSPFQIILTLGLLMKLNTGGVFRWTVYALEVSYHRDIKEKCNISREIVTTFSYKSFLHYIMSIQFKWIDMSCPVYLFFFNNDVWPLCRWHFTVG